MRYVSTLIALSLLSIGIAQIPENVPTEGLVAWYPFNGNAQDESGNGHHAAIDGATLTDDRYGNFDAAFYFDGSDRIIAPHTVSPEGNSARTINAFFKSYTALPVGNNQYSLQAIFGSGSAAGGKVISSLNIDGNGTNNGHIPRTGHLYFSSGSWQDEAWSQGSVSDSLWHMATMTYQGPNTPVRVYLDGQLQDETDPITLSTHLSDFYIGDVPWAVLFFNGLIDDLGVWNRALTPDEILALLGPEIPTGCTDSNACNFSDDAVVDDGSCIPSGCTDSYACNFDAASGCDDGSCDYTCCPGPACCLSGTYWSYELEGCVPENTPFLNDLDSTAILNSCYFDTDFDGLIGVPDLMNVLSVFGLQCGEYLVEEETNGGTSDLCSQMFEEIQATFLGINSTFKYYSVGDTLTWFEAESYAQCLTNEAHLASVHSAAEVELFTSWTAEREMPWHWIGIYQDFDSPEFSEPSGGWTWIDGSPLDFTNWAGPEPNNGSGFEHHGHMNHVNWGMGVWNDGAGDIYEFSGLIQVPIHINTWLDE